MSDEVEFVGSDFKAIGPINPWPLPGYNLLERSKGNGGEISLWVTEGETFVASFHPAVDNSFFLETCPIRHADKGGMVLILVWEEDTAQIFINGKLAASTNSADAVESLIEISEPSPREPKDFSAENEIAQYARQQWATGRTVRIGRRELTLEETAAQLNDAYCALQDTIKGFREGAAYLGTQLPNQLRALICLPRGSAMPLLQRTAGLLDLPLIVYSIPDDIPPEVAAILEDASLQISICIDTTPKPPNETEMDLDVWLNMHAAFASGDRYTNDAVLRAIANTTSSHFDPDLEPLVDELRSRHTSLGDGPYGDMILKFLLPVGVVVAGLCEQVLLSAKEHVS